MQIQIGNFRQEVGAISYQSARVRPNLSLILGLVLGLLLPLLIIGAIIGYLIYRYRLRKPVPKRTLPGPMSLNQRSDGQGNSYVEAGRDAPEMVPLQQPQQNNQSTYDDVMDPNLMKGWYLVLSNWYIIIFYFENVTFFYAKLGLEVCPRDSTRPLVEKSLSLSCMPAPLRQSFNPTPNSLFRCKSFTINCSLYFLYTLSFPSACRITILLKIAISQFFTHG